MSTFGRAMGGLALGALLATAGAGFAAEVRVTTNAGNQENPSISGSIIVWQDDRSGNPDIYGYNLLTTQEFAICTNSAGQYRPDISGHIVAYDDMRNGNWDIYYYDLDAQTEGPVVVDPGGSSNSAVSGTQVVWTDTRASNADIYYKDVGTGTGKAICTYMSTQTNPDISGNLVVWQDVRGGFNNFDIYGYDLNTSTEFQVTTNTSHQQNPAISGHRVVYEDKRNGNWDIYMKDLDTSIETPICTAAGDQTEPAIDGDLIVWTDARSGNPDLYAYDLALAMERPVCVNPSQQVHPNVSGGRIVWADNRNGNWDIYTTILGSPPSLSSGYVTPQSGTTSTQFTYRVKYWNASGLVPDAVSVAIWTGWGNSMRWYRMWELDPSDTNVTDGKWYTLSCYLDGSAHAFRFAAQCGYDAAYWPTPAGQYASGPAVDPVTLSSGYVMPGSGSGGATFTWRLKYWNGVNAGPLSVSVGVWSSGGTTWCPMSGLDATDTTYRDGKWYTFSQTLPAGTYAYRFAVHAPDKWYYWPSPSGSYVSGPAVGG